jgi:carboxyl-terminal processing protease
MHQESRKKIVILVIVIICLFLAAGLGQQTAQKQPRDSEIRENLRMFAIVYDVVEQNYAEPVDPNRAIYEGAIPGMLRVLDPHSTFFDPKSYADLEEEQSGKYYGVGMTIGPRTNRIVVVSPTVGSPAYKAGVRPGDVIVAVDGKSTDNMTTSDVAELVRGPKGTTVHIQIMRQGSPAPLDFSLIRTEIPRESVDVHFLVRPGVGYMHISMFNETTDREVQKALDQFGQLQGLVLDLRGDPGGLLDQAVKVSEKFLPKGSVIVSQRGRASPEKIYRATRGSRENYPIVVLVDRGTASAAEIVSGALQDHDRGLIAGENTFGKGLVQTVFPLSEKTGLALTTGKYYTPSGRLIQRNYEGVSLYDYYYNNHSDENAKPPQDAKVTDGGRTVYGGDGITPDVRIAAPKTNHFQDTLLQQYVFFDFAQDYISRHVVGPDFEVTEPLLQEFRRYLTAHKVKFTETELTQNLDWARNNLKAEIISNRFGLQAGLKARAESDPEVRQALDLLPKAHALQVAARRALAERVAKSATGATQ